MKKSPPAPPRKAPRLSKVDAPEHPHDTGTPKDEMPGAAGFSQVELGARLREARHEAKLTLQQLSRSSGYSVTHLSQVERGHACPTIGALRRITAAIGRDIKAFLEASPLPDVSLVRRDERPRIQLEASYLQVEPVTTRIPGGELQAAVHVVKPFSAREPARPKMAENARFYFVLKGRVELVLDGRAEFFEAGQAVHVAAKTPIAYRNTEREPCELLVVSLGSPY